jgi:hypothetical protein
MHPWLRKRPLKTRIWKTKFNNSAVFHQEAAAGKRKVKENSLQKKAVVNEDLDKPVLTFELVVDGRAHYRCDRLVYLKRFTLIKRVTTFFSNNVLRKKIKQWVDRLLMDLNRGQWAMSFEGVLAYANDA